MNTSILGKPEISSKEITRDICHYWIDYIRQSGRRTTGRTPSLLGIMYRTIWLTDRQTTGALDYRSDPVITGYYVSDSLTNGPSENGGVGLQVYHTITATTVPYSIVFKLYYIYYIPEHVKIEKAW